MKKFANFRQVNAGQSYWFFKFENFNKMEPPACLTRMLENPSWKFPRQRRWYMDPSEYSNYKCTYRELSSMSILSMAILSRWKIPGKFLSDIVRYLTQAAHLPIFHGFSLQEIFVKIVFTNQKKFMKLDKISLIRIHCFRILRFYDLLEVSNLQLLLARLQALTYQFCQVS